MEAGREGGRERQSAPPGSSTCSARRGPCAAEPVAATTAPESTKAGSYLASPYSLGEAGSDLRGKDDPGPNGIFAFQFHARASDAARVPVPRTRIGRRTRSSSTRPLLSCKTVPGQTKVDEEVMSIRATAGAVIYHTETLLSIDLGII
ncbi:uncharacterized protein LOC119357449 [Triticum dicoccoides]|uniref:uncharacterized protein LOC119357449 n=1 Tax=Triticum dicoccoides TaxID=85692 RepID=UPI00188F3FBC|nr:uncharacterized protein LOC119357449 [Triticum dicoccoides]